VRNIVNELQGEKIDIVRFNEDIREYIKAALSPAEVSEIKLDKDNLKALVIVDDSQLSLAIGKHGQNVRLASRLIGWELDIRTKTALLEAEKAAQEAEAAASLQKTEKRKKKEAVSLEELTGVGDKILENLKAAGIKSIEDLLKTDSKDLTKIKGIGIKRAQKLIEEAKNLKA